MYCTSEAPYIVQKVFVVEMLQLSFMVHDTENLTFSADDRAENSHISARTISGFRADNQRIPCGTISKFYSYNDISNNPCGVFLDPLTLLRTKFPPFSNQIRAEDPRPPPHGKSAAPARKFRGTRAENPRRSARNNHGIPRKKLSFPCHVLYVNYVMSCHLY